MPLNSDFLCHVAILFHSLLFKPLQICLNYSKDWFVDVQGFFLESSLHLTIWIDNPLTLDRYGFVW